MLVSARTLLRNPLTLTLFVLVFACHPAFAGRWSDPEYTVTGDTSDLFLDGDNFDHETWDGDTQPWANEIFAWNLGVGHEMRMEEHGTVQATFTWIYDDPAHPENDPPPAYAYLLETSTAEWDANRDASGSGDASGPVNNGLGDPATPPQTSSGGGYYFITQSSEGVHMRRKDASSGQITTSCTLDVSFHLKDPVSDWEVQSSPGYDVAIVPPPAAMITSSIDTSYHKAADGTRQPNLASDDGSDTNGDSAAIWNIPFQAWEGDSQFVMNASGFNSPTYSWMPGGSLMTSVDATQPFINCHFNLGAGSSGSLSSTTTTCDVSDSSGKDATGTYNIQWHLPYEVTDSIGDITGNEVYETRYANAEPGVPVTVPLSSGGKLDFSGLVDNVSVITEVTGQEEATVALKIVSAISGITEWFKNYDEEPQYISAVNGQDAWNAANAAEHGNDPDYIKHIPDQYLSDPLGWTHCSMNLVRVKYTTISSWTADKYDVNGYDSSGHAIQTLKVTSTHDEQIFQPIVY